MADKIAQPTCATARGLEGGVTMADGHAFDGQPSKPGVRDELRERLLSVATMDRTLRIATVITFAGLIAAAAAIAAREVKAPPVALGVVGGVQVTLSAPLFAVSLVLLCCGLGYLVAAVMLATRVVAVAGAVFFTALVGWTTGVLGLGGLNTVLPAWAQWVTRGLMFAILTGTLVVLLLRRGRNGDDPSDRRLRPIVVIAACVLFGGYFLVLWIASPVLDGLTLFPQTVSLLMTDVALLATPLLMIAAIDFGEWGKFGVQLIVHRRDDGAIALRPSPSRVRASVILCAVAIVVGFVVLRGSVGDRLWGLTEALLLVGVALTVLLLGGRALRVSRFGWPRSLSFAALFGICAVVTWVIAPSSGAIVGAFAVPPTPPVTVQGDYTVTASVHSEAGRTGFTALIPVGWRFVADRANRIDDFSNTYPSGLKVVLSGLIAPSGTSAHDLESAIGATQVGGVAHDGQWMRASVLPKTGGSGTLWLRPEGAHVRVFYGVAIGADAAASLPQLEAIVRTVRSSDQTPDTLAAVLAKNGGLAEFDATTEHHADTLQSVAVGIELALTIIGLALFGVFGRRWSPTWRIIVLGFAAVTTITLIATFSALGRVAAGPSATWPVLSVGGLLAASGVLGAVAVAVSRRSTAVWAARLLTSLPAMLGAIIALVAVYELYGAALGAASVPAWAAILILAAVGWDILASGESITNLSSRAFGRSTRVLAYFGYILVLAAAMVFYSGQVSSATGHPVAELFFEPESTTQSALFRVGFPVLLVMFLLRIASPDRADADSAAMSVESSHQKAAEPQSA